MPQILLHFQPSHKKKTNTLILQNIHPVTLQNLGMEQKIRLFPQEHYLTTKAAQ